MKIIITESQYDELIFTRLPNFLKRRITMEDLEWFDKNINSIIITTPPLKNFSDFSHAAFDSLLHNFIYERKNDEIETYYDAEYDEDFLDEVSFGKIGDMYWELTPFLEQKYRDRLYLNWERKKSL